MLRMVWIGRTQNLGAEHPDTLRTAGNLAQSLSGQGKYAEAEQIEREVLDVKRRVLGEEHPSTLTTANNLAASLSRQGKHADAERIHREVLGAERRVLGAEHPGTLTTANNVASSLRFQGKYAEAERIQREVHSLQIRVLGAEHPSTLLTANNLAASLSYQDKYAEAEEILQGVLATSQRVLGSAHPNTLSMAESLENVRSEIRAEQQQARTDKAAAATTAGVANRLPVGTRVLLHRLVGKAEHNGKRARVLSFDERGGRYTLALDDGTELSLKPESVVRAGCDMAGCASDEASSVCARCQLVRYCSRECQRADWKAHKPACTAVALLSSGETSPGFSSGAASPKAGPPANPPGTHPTSHAIVHKLACIAAAAVLNSGESSPSTSGSGRGRRRGDSSK
jgi:hypothetical protein